MKSGKRSALAAFALGTIAAPLAAASGAAGVPQRLPVRVGVEAGSYAWLNKPESVDATKLKLLLALEVARRTHQNWLFGMSLSSTLCCGSAQSYFKVQGTAGFNPGGGRWYLQAATGTVTYSARGYAGVGTTKFGWSERLSVDYSFAASGHRHFGLRASIEHVAAGTGTIFDASGGRSTDYTILGAALTLSWY